MVIRTPGAEANASGKFLESIVELQAKEHGYTILRWNDRPAPGPCGYVDRLLLKNVPYVNIYGTTSRSEFIVISESSFAVIECRWQSVGGSVDEKWPYLILNAEKLILDKICNVVVILYGGGGARPESILWSKQRVSGRSDIRVLNQDEFRLWFRSYG